MKEHCNLKEDHRASQTMKACSGDLETDKNNESNRNGLFIRGSNPI